MARPIQLLQTRSHNLRPVEVPSSPLVVVALAQPGVLVYNLQTNTKTEIALWT
jgi:hypothetical protein